jgi:Pro-kumamolisin, activation domain
MQQNHPCRHQASFKSTRVVGLMLAAILCSICGLASDQSFSAPVPTDRIIANVDESRLTLLPGSTSRKARPELDRGRAPDNLAQEHILMMLRRGERQHQALLEFISRQYEPRSPDFHRWLTPQQFGAAFGPSAEDIRKVTQWLTRHGFTVNGVPEGGLFVDFSGNATGSTGRTITQTTAILPFPKRSLRWFPAFAL